MAAVRMSLPDTPGNERMHRLSRLKSYTTHHLSVGVGRSVALSNTHTHTHTQVHRIGKSCECEATGSEIQMEYVQEEKRHLLVVWINCCV